MKNLWHFTRQCNEPGNSVPLPPYIYIAFTNPEMTRRIHQDADLTTHMTGRCIEALVVSNRATDINFRNVPNDDDKLACLSTILGTRSHDVKLCLGQPGTIEIVNLVSLTFGDISSLRADQVSPDTRSVFHQTLALLSQRLQAQKNTGLPLDQTAALVSISDDKLERTIVLRLYGLLKICIPGPSHHMEEARTSCMRICLRCLWHCAKVYHQISDPLPSYFPLMLASPDITRQLQTEQDPVARITGCCFGALIVSKLVDAFESHISLSSGVCNSELACISAILGTEYHKVPLLPHQLRLLNFRNVVSLISGEIETIFSVAGLPAADVLNIA